MSAITSQIVHLASDAYGDHLATVGGSPSNGDELDAMRAALEVAEAAWKKSTPEHQTDMLMARMVLNQVVVPGAQPVEAAGDDRLAAAARAMHSVCDGEERWLRMSDEVRNQWIDSVRPVAAALAHPRPVGDVPRYTHLPIDLWEAIAKNSVWLMRNARDGYYTLDQAIEYQVGAIATGRDPAPTGEQAEEVVGKDGRVPPRWYTLQEIEHCMQRMSYSDAVIAELAPWFFRHIKSAFDKGYNMALNNYEPTQSRPVGVPEVPRG